MWPYAEHVRANPASIFTAGTDAEESAHSNNKRPFETETQAPQLIIKASSIIMEYGILGFQEE